MTTRASLLAAGALGSAIVICATAIVAIPACWLLPFIVTMLQGGWERFASIPRDYGVFPDPVEKWLDQGSWLFYFVKWGSVALLIAGAGVGASLGVRLWRFLVVKKLGWMTAVEAEELLNRDPGF